MNNTKETLSSVRNVIPDIGGNFQLDPAVIHSTKRRPNEPPQETKLYQNSQKELRSFKQAAMEPHSGHGLLEWRPHWMEIGRTTF